MSVLQEKYFFFPLELCAAFSARVGELVCELNGEYGLWLQHGECRNIPQIANEDDIRVLF